MTDTEFKNMGKAFELGYLDGVQNGKGRLQQLVTVQPTDQELSDYWYGWHQGKRLQATR